MNDFFNNDVFFHKKEIFEVLLQDRVFIERYLGMCLLESLKFFKKYLKVYIKVARWERIRSTFLKIRHCAK